MLVGKLSDHLKYLVSNTRKAKDGRKSQDQSYHSILEGRPALNELFSEVLAFNDDEGCGNRHVHKRQFSIQLLKKIILTQFELLCVSVELHNDVEYAFSEYRFLCEHISLFNSKMISTFCRSKCLMFADFADIAISTQTHSILKAFVVEASVANIVSWAKFEHGFISALTALFATYTSLLLPPDIPQKQNNVFVSEEMFSMAQSSSLSWLDCLIPGAQSEVLRLTVKELISRLWGKVASNMVALLQPLIIGGERTEALLTLLRNALEHQELSHHCAVKKCLWYTLSAIEHQQSLSNWDKCFQAMLVVSPQDTRKNFKPSKMSETHTTQSVHVFLTQVLPSLNSPRTKKPLDEPSSSQRNNKTLPSPLAISYHIDDLRLHLPHIVALQVSLEHVTRYLLQGLKKSLANMNMRSIGQLLMADGSLVLSALSKTVLHVAHISCPRYHFPHWSKLHFTESCSRVAYDTAYANYTKLKDLLELSCVSFHDMWQESCSQVFLVTYPKVKFWKSINKKGDRHNFEPGRYCNDVIENLLLPVIEASTGIAAQQAQLSFLMLTVNVFLTELRRAITANKKIYSSSSGRQLLVDFRHIRDWLTSQELGLTQEASQLLFNLPALSEIERGLMEVCGTADQVDSGAALEFGEAWSALNCASLLPVCREQAWATDKDWLECTL